MTASALGPSQRFAEPLTREVVVFSEHVATRGVDVFRKVVEVQSDVVYRAMQFQLGADPRCAVIRQNNSASGPSLEDTEMGRQSCVYLAIFAIPHYTP